MLKGFKYNTLIRLGFEACLPLTVACFIAFKEEDTNTYVGLASKFIAGTIFFLLLSFAALTTAVSLLVVPLDPIVTIAAFSMND